MRITKLAIDRLPIPKSLKPRQSTQKRYYDDTLKGFGVRTTSGGTKAFFIEKIISHKQRRLTLGHYPELTVGMARKEAQKVLGKIAIGIDPVAEKKEHIAKRITLKQAFEDYLHARKALKPRTIFEYHQVMKESFADWQSKTLLSITKDMIAKRHTLVGKRSHARSNLAMRVLRAIFNFAAGEYEDAKGHSLITENPVKRLSHTRAWFRVERRQTVIKTHALPAWYQGIVNLTNRYPEKAEMFKDYFLLVLFTGLRRHEASALQWKQIDFKEKTLTIIDTKNRQNHTLPLSDFLVALFNKRYKQATFNKINKYVFPASSKEGYLVEPRKAMLKVIENSGVHFDIHMLRRTFITIAESLDIPIYALKKLLNHKMNNDVTAGYIAIDIERLREPMQKITDFLLKATKINDIDNVIKLDIAHSIYK